MHRVVLHALDDLLVHRQGGGAVVLLRLLVERPLHQPGNGLLRQRQVLCQLRGSPFP